MLDPEDDNPNSGYWPSVSDLFITLFIISVAILGAVVFVLMPKSNSAPRDAVIEAVGGLDLISIRTPINTLRPTIGLEPVPDEADPNAVVTSLKETCESANDIIVELRENLATFDQQGLLQRLAELESENADLIAQNKELQAKIKELTAKLEDAMDNNGWEEVERLKGILNDKPPIIRIDEQKEQYQFPSGSSLIGPQFADGLKDVEFEKLAKEIIDRQQQGRAKVDTLEIIGHTDGIPLAGSGNLDSKLPRLLAGDTSTFQSLRAGSNNDLGLLRALAVKAQWDAFTDAHEQKSILQSITVRCYSAGQTILPSDKRDVEQADFEQDDAKARRIEMRLTRLRD
ncbi:hypothetical protein [Sulfuriroseicoccus oceanibius]|uniref:OmpA-like domain-containing protein n=1 Tax=Sulfuriroseicoccus oceanibius TaxID=2707525 RepID=A0A6B3L4M8_9BACT|nr:hypothetical protein [Sulfuriroseicoccus oceanibius]QQL43758.1 hypothetical protein G3M56_007545 [Sulfuriroseicoccus oceanibius]